MNSQERQCLPAELLLQFEQNDGHALDDSIQRRLNGIFGSRFPAIRVFEDEGIAAAGALAIARGPKIGFAPSCYDPDSAAGRAIILHETGHVLQWLAGLTPGRPDTRLSNTMLLDASLERGADDAAQWLAGARPAPAWPPRRPEVLPCLPVALPLQVLKVNMDLSWIFFVVDPRSAPPAAPTGYTRYWDDILQDYVDVPNFITQEYLYVLQQALARRAWEQQRALPRMQPRSLVAPRSTALPVPVGPTGLPLPGNLATAVVNTVSAPIVPKKVVWTSFFKDDADRFFSCFTQKELMELRCVSVLFREEAESMIWRKMVQFTGASTVIGGQMPSHPSMKKVIQDHLTNVRMGGGTALMASDQITSKTALLQLIGEPIKIKINIGSKVGPGILNDLSLGARMVEAPSDHGRPHTKFISGGGSVFVGSPNFTPSALGGGNIETAVSASSLQVQGFFNRYWQLMRDATVEDRVQFRDLLQAFNARGHKMRLALAPYIHIQPFILDELQDASTIVIRMFLISHRKTNDDIVTGLNALARNGAEITVVVDEGQYKKHYVREALAKLVKGTKNVTVHLQTSYMGGGASIMHDKLILAQIGKGEAIRKRVMLGSSGFTTNVMANDNYDLMVSIDEDALFDYFMGHHKATLDVKSHITTKQIQYK
jgi:hypothetical protein